MILDQPQIPKPTDLRAAYNDRLAREARTRSLREYGRQARRMGRPLKSCPRFVDPDMACDWRAGWRDGAEP